MPMTRVWKSHSTKREGQPRMNRASHVSVTRCSAGCVLIRVLPEGDDPVDDLVDRESGRVEKMRIARPVERAGVHARNRLRRVAQPLPHLVNGNRMSGVSELTAPAVRPLGG